MSTLLHDLRYALRALRRDSTGLLVAVGVLALAIGANTAPFSVVEAVVLRALPVEEPDRLVDVGMTRREDLATATRGGTPSRFVMETIRDRRRSFEAVTGFGGARPVLTGRGDPARLRAEVVEPAFFAVVGARALLGRTFVPEEGAGGRRAVVLSHGLWTARFGADLWQTARATGSATRWWWRRWP